MAYKNIVWVKMERRLLNDYRWYQMSYHAQLLYVKLILFAAETYNKIPKPTPLLMSALRMELEIGQFKCALEEVIKNFPKFKCNKHFYYFDEFENKTNWIPHQQSPSNRSAIARHDVDKDKDKDKDKDTEKDIMSDYTKTVKLYFDLYEMKYKNKPLFNSSDGKLLKTLLLSQKYSDIENRMKLYFNNEFWFTKDGGRSLKSFFRNYNEIVLKSNSKNAQLSSEERAAEIIKRQRERGQ